MTDAGKSYELRVVRRNPWLLALAASPLAASLAALVAMITLEPLLGLFIPHLLILGTVALAITWKKNRWPRLEPAALQVDGDHVHIGRRSVSKKSIHTGLVVPRKQGVAVELTRGHFQPSIELRAKDEDEARQVLTALGLDASQTTARLHAVSRLAEPSRRYLVGGGLLATMVGAMASSPIVGGLAAALTFFAAAMISAVLLGTGTAVEVGTDGLQLRWLWYRRFVRFGDIESLAIEEHGIGKVRRRAVVARLASGEPMMLTMSDSPWGDRADALLTRIRQAMSASACDANAPDDALFQRHEREHVDWVRALRSGAELGSHRRAPLQLDRLWRLIEDAAIDPIVRAAAAIAVSPSIDEAQRKRLELCSAATAEPKLRIALDAVAGGKDEQALAEALAEVEAEAAPQRARTL